MWGNEDKPGWYSQSADANKYEPKWEKLVDYSPDRNPSASKVITAVVGNQPCDGGNTPARVIRVFQVRGVGVIICQAAKESTADGKLVFEGMAILSKEDIGYAPAGL